jgi:hypothetical protein
MQQSVSYVIRAEMLKARDKSNYQWVFFTGGCEDTTWAREAEESPLLEAVVRVRLVKTRQSAKGVAGAMVICELWRLALAL